MSRTEQSGEYELTRKEELCKFCNKKFRGIHGLRIHLQFEKKNASSLKEVYQIQEEIARVKRRYRAILND